MKVKESIIKSIIKGLKGLILYILKLIFIGILGFIFIMILAGTFGYSWFVLIIGVVLALFFIILWAKDAYKTG